MFEEQVDRIFITVDFFSSGFCDGAPFLSEEIISKTPDALRLKISDHEWTCAMRHIQTVTMNEIPSMCSKITLCMCYGLPGLLCLSSSYNSATRRINEAIRQVNLRVFEPKDLFIALKNSQIDCYTSSNVLVIALNSTESKLLKAETHYL